MTRYATSVPVSQSALRVLAAAAAAVVLTSCGVEPVAEQAGDDPVVVVPSSVPTVAPTTVPSAAPSAASPAASPAGRVVEIGYAGGEVTGVDSRLDVALGKTLLLRITSDVAEQLHVHGYDQYADLIPGQTVEVALTADLAGGFEVELEQSGRTLTQLRVS